MKRIFFFLAFGLAILPLAGCSLYSLGNPTPLPTPVFVYATATHAATPTAAAPASSGIVATPTTSALLPTPAEGSILPGSPSGPYAVIRVDQGDALNIRSAAGVGNPAIGSFPPTTTNVMRTGPSTSVDEELWVQVQNPAGNTGWVNAFYLSEYVAPSTFCADTRVNSLLSSFGNAIKTSNGEALSSLVSPVHGMAVRLWRNGNVVIFDRAHAQWIFVSTYEHNWGEAAGSGLDTMGAIHVVVLPKWLDVLNASFTLGCNVPQAGGASYDSSWPAFYANVNYYSLYKPGPAGSELSWRTLLIGVEYVQGQPYIFSIIQMDWEP
jgi:hypothetical protein